MTRLTIGHYGPFSLLQARERAEQSLNQIEAGQFGDRTGIEVETKQTLGEVIPDYIEQHAKVHSRDWKRKEALLSKFTSLHGKRIDEIKRADVVKACDVTHKSAPIKAYALGICCGGVPDTPADLALSICIRNLGDRHVRHHHAESSVRRTQDRPA